MPAHLPPPLAPSLSPLADQPDASQALGGPNNPLEAAYRLAVHALGVHCVGASLLTVDGPLPVGLQAFLDRHNPALAQVALAQPTTSRRFITADRILAGELEKSDRQVLAWLVRENLLQAMPAYAVDGVDDVGANGGLTRTEWGFPELTRVAVGSNPMPIFRLNELGLKNRVDPVLFRWLVVLHESGHAQMALDPVPFGLAGLTLEERTLINQVMQGPTSVSDHFTHVFKESYADAFAALTLLRLAHASAPALQTVEALRKARAHLSADLATQAAFDVDATGATLDRLCEDLLKRPDHLAALQVSTPEQVHQWAGKYASWGARQWALHWETNHPLSPVFGEGWVIPEAGQAFTPLEKETVTRAFFTLQEEKVAAYGRQRLVAYLLAGPHGELKPPQTDGDPLLETLAHTDVQTRLLFERAKGDEGHAKASILLRAPIFLGANADLIAATFEGLPEVQVVMAHLRLEAGLMLDSPVFVAEEGRFHLARVERARAALLRPLPTNELWGAPVPDRVSQQIARRRRRF